MVNFSWLLGTVILWGLLALSIMLLALIGLAATLLRPSTACPDELVGLLAEPERGEMTPAQKVQAVKCLLVWVLAGRTSLDILQRRLRRLTRLLWLLAPLGGLLGLAGWAVNHAARSAVPAGYPWLEIALGLAVAIEAAVLAWVISTLGGKSLKKIHDALEFLIEVRTGQLQTLQEASAGHNPPANADKPTATGLLGLVMLFCLSFVPHTWADVPATQPVSQPTTASAPAPIVVGVNAYGLFTVGEDQKPLAGFQLAQRLTNVRVAAPASPVCVVSERKLSPRERQQVQRILARAQVPAEEIIWREPESDAAATQPTFQFRMSQRWLTLVARPVWTASQPAQVLGDPAGPILRLIRAMQTRLEPKPPPATQPS